MHVRNERPPCLLPPAFGKIQLDKAVTLTYCKGHKDLKGGYDDH